MVSISNAIQPNREIRSEQLKSLDFETIVKANPDTVYDILLHTKKALWLMDKTLAVIEAGKRTGATPRAIHHKQGEPEPPPLEIFDVARYRAVKAAGGYGAKFAARILV